MAKEEIMKPRQRRRESNGVKPGSASKINMKAWLFGENVIQRK
jgi:hypothetical protein